MDQDLDTLEEALGYLTSYVSSPAMASYSKVGQCYD